MTTARRHRHVPMTAAQLRKAESNGWRVTEYVTHKRGTFVNLVSRSGRPRTVRLVDAETAR